MPPQTVSSVLIDGRGPSHAVELRYINDACITQEHHYGMRITPDQNLVDTVNHLTSLREFQSRFSLDGWHTP